MSGDRQRFARRLRRFSWLIAGALVVLGLRLAWLQVVQGEHYAREAHLNMVWSQPIAAPRGDIRDARGRVLARNVPRFSISFLPDELSHPTRALEEVARLLDMEPGQVRELLEQNRRAPAEPIVLRRTLDPQALARVAEVQGDFPGIRLVAHPLREYPLGEVACHVLGHLGEVDAETLKRFPSRGYYPGEWVGQDGLEARYDRFLRGRPGVRSVQVDAAGRPVGVVGEDPPRPGATLYLALDSRLQEAAHAALKETLYRLEQRNGVAPAGVVVAMEPDSGKIRAMVSLPGYDPNWYARGISQEQFSRLVEDPRAPLLNRAISGTYPPASTFKIVTTAAALDAGVARPGEFFSCPGWYRLGGQVVHCFLRRGHGALDLVDSLALSCDVTYYRLGTRLGGERLSRAARSFGLGRPTGVDLPGEAAGLVPDAAWKQENLGEPWFAGDDLNLAIGQGYLAVTPLQMTVVVAAVVNGGTIWRPYLVERVVSSSGRLVRRFAPVARGHLPVTRPALEVVRRGMEEAVRRGTARRARPPGLAVAGKTGTVEKTVPEGAPAPLNDTWFVGYAPADRPALVVCVFLERSGGYGGEAAAPVAARVLEAWQPLRTGAWSSRDPEPAAGN